VHLQIDRHSYGFCHQQHLNLLSCQSWVPVSLPISQSVSQSVSQLVSRNRTGL
jgi:hypothetical protein